MVLPLSGLRGSLGRRQRARPGARRLARTADGHSGSDGTRTGPRCLGPGAGRAPFSASSAAAAAAAPLRLQTQHGGGGGAENKGPGRANGSSGPRSVRAGPRERRARAAAAAAGGHGQRRRRRRRRQRLRGALGVEARPFGAHPPREEGTGQAGGGAGRARTLHHVPKTRSRDRRVPPLESGPCAERSAGPCSKPPLAAAAAC